MFPPAAPLLAACLLLGGDDPGRPAAVPPEREDANLHALHCAGDRVVACGDWGTVWTSADAGRSWTHRPAPTGLHLRGLSFLTDEIGWAAGGGTEPYTAASVGVVLKTADGGATWDRVDVTPLPAVVAVRFFTPNRGAAACVPTDAAPSGLWETADGGATWEPRPGVRLGYWRAAALPAPGRSLLVGERGRVSLQLGGELVAAPAAPGGPAALTAVTLARGGSGVAAAEGGGLWKTASAGRAWEPLKAPPGLPPGAADWRGVWAGGGTLAVVGDPGGAVFTAALRPGAEPDWVAGFTGQTAPLNAVAFAPDSKKRPYGLAVGDLGAVVRTDGPPGTAAAAGWRPVRGGGRRAAVLVVTADPARAPFVALARHAADGGHRAVVLCPVRRDVGAAAAEPPGQADRLDHAALAAGGSGSALGFALPLAVPGADADPAALAADWDRRLDGDHRPALRDRIARAVRTWRPDVVVVDLGRSPAGPRDAAAELVRAAADAALADAADPTRLLDLDRLGLRPWRPSRVLEHRPAGEFAAVSESARAPLPHLGGEAGDLAAAAAARLGGVPVGDEAFAPVTGAGTGFLTGVHLTPGGDARRPGRPRSPPPDPAVALRRRTLASLSARVARGERTTLVAPAALPAQLDRLTAGLPDRLAAADLARLARDLLGAGELDAAETVLIELARRFPAEPAAHAALPDLLRLWCGSERDLLRLADDGVRVARTDGDAVTRTGGAVTGTPAVTTAEALDVGGGRGYRAVTRKHRLEQAVKLGEFLAGAAPRRFAAADVRRSLAVARRDLGVVPGPDAPAVGDVGALTGTLVAAAAPTPRLDGVLADPCWVTADAVSLADPAGLAPGGLAMAATDGRFLFLAAALPADPRHPPAPRLAGRGHDADLSASDRLELTLDPDGDLGTAWRFAVAGDGRTAEDCCGDPAWDPEWFAHVAFEPGLGPGDAGGWRVEAAVPLAALSAAPPSPNRPWAVRLRRVVPGVGAADWPPPDPDAVAVPVDADRPFGRLRWAR